MFVVAPECVKVDGIRVNAVLGVPQNWGRAAEYDLLLNGNLCLEKKQ